MLYNYVVYHHVILSGAAVPNIGTIKQPLHQGGLNVISDAFYHYIVIKILK